VEDRFISVETKLSYQEKTIAELNEVVTTQHRQITELERRVRALEAQAQTGETEPGRRDPGDERPPHY
jgi:SlyX protein